MKTLAQLSIEKLRNVLGSALPTTIKRRLKEELAINLLERLESHFLANFRALNESGFPFSDRAKTVFDSELQLYAEKMCPTSPERDASRGI